MGRKTPGLNTASSADIAFLLLTFFLLTSSINTEQGIPRRLPPPKDPKATEDVVAINKRNVLDVRVNFSDAIMVNGNPVDISELKEMAKNFLANPTNDPELPMKESKDIEGIGNFMVSKGVISLTNDQSTTYNMYVLVQNELQRAINELRNQTAMNYFGKKYDNLDTALQKSVQKAIPANISEAKSINHGGN